MKRRALQKILWATLTGVASGTVLGMLFAPDKGAKTRKKVAEQGDKYLKVIKKDVGEIRKYLNDRARTAQKEASSVRKNAREKGQEVVEKAQKLASYDAWTKEELYERAKEAKIDGYSQMNKDELIEALRR